MFKTKRGPLYLIFASATVSLYFSFRLATALFDYSSLQESREAKITRWEVEEIKGKYAIRVDYSFKVKEKNWSGRAILSGPLFLNELAAIESIKTRAKGPWVAWYNAHNPARSALEKSFPLGLFARAAISIGVLIYFYILKRRFC